MTDTPHCPEDDKISLLDLLQTIAENLRLFIIGPIVVGQSLLAGAASCNCPRNTSTVNVKVQPAKAQAVYGMAQALLAVTPPQPAPSQRWQSDPSHRQAV